MDIFSKLSEVPNKGVFLTASIKWIQEVKLSCIIKIEDKSLLADCANDAGFFKRKITAHEMNDLMYGTLATPLVAANLMRIAYFF